MLRANRRTAAGLGVAPRISILYRVLDWRDHGGLSATAAFGRGLRSLEAVSLSQDERAPIGKITSAELGGIMRRAGLWGHAQVRGAAFYTGVDNDLVFDEGAGHNVFAGETTRWGGTALAVVESHGLAATASATYTYAVFGDGIPPTYQYFNSDRVPGKRMPYVPPLVTRLDATYRWTPRASLTVRHGLGVTYVSPRPLPQSQESDAVFTVDASTTARYGGVEVGLSVENLLDRAYALAEYNFSSWFPAVSGTDFPTRVPTRQVSPGAPRTVLVTITLYLDQLLPHRDPKEAP